MRSPSHSKKLCDAIAWKSNHAMNSTVTTPSATFAQRSNLLVYSVTNGVKLRTAFGGALRELLGRSVELLPRDGADLGDDLLCFLA